MPATRTCTTITRCIRNARDPSLVAHHAPTWVGCVCGDKGYKRGRDVPDANVTRLQRLPVQIRVDLQSHGGSGQATVGLSVLVLLLLLLRLLERLTPPNRLL